jgi:2-succinyl-6-hydroxy-2,4-cyclohexadiene-1-carboxylate synthase
MLHYELVGNGKPVVFLHGFLESLEMWKSLNLKRFLFQSILVDLPGHGKTALLTDEVSILAIAQEVEKLLESLELENYSIVGHSMGGYIALELAKRNPNIDQIILLNSNFWEDSEKKKSDRNRVIKVIEKNKNRFISEAIPGLFAKPEKHADFIQNLIHAAQEISQEAVIYATSAMRDRPSSELIAQELGDKLKIIQGEKDQVIPMKEMLERTDKMEAELIVLSEVAHMSHVEETGDLELILADFLK